MTGLVNRQVRLKSRPQDIPSAEHFEIVAVPAPGPGPGQILVRNHFLSVDPAMRGWVSSVPNYSPPVALGEVMRAFAVGRVIASRHPSFSIGDTATGLFGWQDYAAVDAGAARRVTESELPMSTALGVLGLNGVAAYFALLELGQPCAGNTVVVSTAAGAVGSCAGQIARLKGCRTVGITGGALKAALCRDAYHYDAVIDYRAGPLDDSLAQACPRGVDVYFDNTAGRISDSVLRHLAVGARVILCGTASIATWEPVPTGPRVERQLLINRARMQGFLAFDYAERFPEAISALSAWIKAGQLHYREDILEGIDQAPGAIAGLFRGENLGKRLIRIA